MPALFINQFFARMKCAKKCAKASRKRLLMYGFVSAFLLLGTVSGVSFADENDARRVDISLSIFPRIVAVDNDFRDKLDKNKKAYLLFVYDKEEDYAEQLAARMRKNSVNIGGMKVEIKTASVNSDLSKENPPTALFVVERMGDVPLEKVMMFSDETHRLLFSPYVGDVERGVMVGISVTNRVKPYFNLSSLRQSKVAINALLMKMSKRYE